MLPARFSFISSQAGGESDGDLEGVIFRAKQLDPGSYKDSNKTGSGGGGNKSGGGGSGHSGGQWGSHRRRRRHFGGDGGGGGGDSGMTALNFLVRYLVGLQCTEKRNPT